MRTSRTGSGPASAMCVPHLKLRSDLVFILSLSAWKSLLPTLSHLGPTFFFSRSFDAMCLPRLKIRSGLVFLLSLPSCVSIFLIFSSRFGFLFSSLGLWCMYVCYRALTLGLILFISLFDILALSFGPLNALLFIFNWHCIFPGSHIASVPAVSGDNLLHDLLLLLLVSAPVQPARLAHPALTHHHAHSGKYVLCPFVIVR